MSYWVAVVARNAAQHLPSTLYSLLHQTLKPKQLVVVDDGSNDATGEILRHYAHEYSRLVKVLTLPDRGYDIRRVPSNINLAWKSAAAAGLKTDYFMISGDDCSYPPDYSKSLISRMISKPQLVVTSGRPSSKTNVSQEHSPSGSGRMIRCSFWREVGEKYPLKAGWETWLLYKAVEKEFQVKLFDDLNFEHLRPRGAKHQFAYWGAAMHTLGYHPLYAIGRIAKNAIGPDIAISRSLNMLRGYLLAHFATVDTFISPFEPSLRKLVHIQQANRITRIASTLL